MVVNGECIAQAFRASVCREIDLVSEGMDRYVVLNPFEYGDGDCLEVVLRKRDGRWELADEGATFMRLSYDGEETDRQRGIRRRNTASALTAFEVEDRDGELVCSVCEGRFGDALFSFVQAILQINSVTYLLRADAQ